MKIKEIIILFIGIIAWQSSAMQSSELRELSICKK